MKIFEQACYNLVKNPEGISKIQLKKLKHHAKSVKIIAKSEYNLRSKKKALTQKGGFLNILLPILGTLVTTFLNK